MMCPNPTPICHLTTEKSPPNQQCLTDLEAIREQVTSIQFETWVGSDCFTIANQILPTEDFVDSLCTVLDMLKPHAYIAEQQAHYFKTLKETIPEGYILDQCCTVFSLE